MLCSLINSAYPQIDILFQTKDPCTNGDGLLHHPAIMNSVIWSCIKNCCIEQTSNFTSSNQFSMTCQSKFSQWKINFTNHRSLDVLSTPTTGTPPRGHVSVSTSTHLNPGIWRPIQAHCRVHCVVPEQLLGCGIAHTVLLRRSSTSCAPMGDLNSLQRVMERWFVLGSEVSRSTLHCSKMIDVMHFSSQWFVDDVVCCVSISQMHLSI